MTKATDIDYARANVLMELVHNVATIAPRQTALLGLAMEELNAMHETAVGILRERGEAKLKEEQDAAARINEANREKAEAEAKAEADRQPKVILATNFTPVTASPGQPVAPIVTQEAEEPGSVVDEIEAEPPTDPLVPLAPTAPIARRTVEEPVV